MVLRLFGKAGQGFLRNSGISLFCGLPVTETESGAPKKRRRRRVLRTMTYIRTLTLASQHTNIQPYIGTQEHDTWNPQNNLKHLAERLGKRALRN